MNRILLLVISFQFLLSPVFAQDEGYAASIRQYRQNYVKNHGAVKGSDKEHFHFYPPDQANVVTANYEQIYEAPWFRMKTSDGDHKSYRVYGILHFTIHDTILKLHIYESQDLMSSKQYADHLFIPFTDLTNGEETYDNGRYIDINRKDLGSSTFVIDFNKSYNPYCAYISNRYSCPVPPRENDLPVGIPAGEMRFGKSH